MHKSTTHSSLPMRIIAGLGTLLAQMRQIARFAFAIR